MELDDAPYIITKTDIAIGSGNSNSKERKNSSWILIKHIFVSKFDCFH